jgi:hypothetical protein
MFTIRFVATATLAAFLVTGSAPAAAQSLTPQRRPAPVRKAQMSGGGGGGGMKLAITLIGTAAGLATTYFLIKEMKKQTDALTVPVQ